MSKLSREWEAQGFTVRDKNKRIICVMSMDEWNRAEDVPDKELESNARLIANAPLLEGITRQFVRYCEQWQRANRQFPNGDGRILILKNAKEALALVEGKER